MLSNESNRRVALHLLVCLGFAWANSVAQANAQTLTNAHPSSRSAWAKNTDFGLKEPNTQWQALRFTGQTPTQFSYQALDGRPTIHALADNAVGMLRHRFAQTPALGTLRFSWKTPALIEAADLAVRALDDAPVRLVLAFDGDRSRLSLQDKVISEMTQTFTGEPMPYATLMYVWCPHCGAESVTPDPRTDRIRKLAIESGPAHLHQWRDYVRDIRSDYVHAFGEEPGPLLSIGIMTDSDNTHSHAEAWYGPISLRPGLLK